MPVYSELVSVIVYGTAIAAPPEACRCCTAVTSASGSLLRRCWHCLRCSNWLAFAGQHIRSSPCLCQTAILKLAQGRYAMHNDRRFPPRSLCKIHFMSFCRDKGCEDSQSNSLPQLLLAGT